MSVVEREQRAVVCDVPQVEERRAGDSQTIAKLYRTVWRWHFYAGLIVAPVLIVAAATGGIYIFKAELERLLYAELMFVAPSAERATYADQVAAIGAAMPEGFKIGSLIVPDDPTHAVSAYGQIEGEYHSVYVDPYRGTFLGTLGSMNFFRVVLDIHRRLFIGTTGRIIVELMTCWTIVLVATGLYLWWPRNGNKVWGALLPRFSRSAYRTLRDLHAVSGAYVAVIALLIASTGLLYTYVWGQGYRYVATKSGAYDIYLNPPKATTPPGKTPLDVDQIVAIAGDAMPGTTLTVRMPADPSLAYVVFGSTPYGPSTDSVVVIDQGAGEIIQQRTNSEFPALAWWSTWNYPLHVGSILGMWTKVPWLIACVGLMLLPITGVWMWWKRRPTGTAGLPRRYFDAKIPRWMGLLILALCVVLPVVGISRAIVGAGGWGRGRVTGGREVALA